MPLSISLFPCLPPPKNCYFTDSEQSDSANVRCFRKVCQVCGTSSVRRKWSRKWVLRISLMIYDGVLNDLCVCSDNTDANQQPNGGCHVQQCRDNVTTGKRFGYGFLLVWRPPSPPHTPPLLSPSEFPDFFWQTNLPEPFLNMAVARKKAAVITQMQNVNVEDHPGLHFKDKIWVADKCWQFSDSKYGSLLQRSGPREWKYGFNNVYGYVLSRRI